MFDRIISDPAILGGKPCIKGTRISVELILEWVAGGATIDKILEAYPHLEREDVAQALRYAARFMEMRSSLPPAQQRETPRRASSHR